MITLCQLFLLFWRADAIKLPGHATPRAFIAAEKNKVWLIRQPELALPELWLWDGSKAKVIEIPIGTLYLRPLTDGKSLFLLMQNGSVARLDLSQSNPVPYELGKLPGTPPPFQPWQWLATSGGDVRDRFALIGPDAAIMGRLDGSELRAKELPKAAQLPLRNSEASELAFVSPSIWLGQTSFYWMNGNQGFVCDWEGKRPIQHLVPPTLKNLESASLLPQIGNTASHWLVFGGNQAGSLGDVFWRLLDLDGKRLQDGKRLLVKFGQDPLASKPRLFLFTTTSSTVGQALGSWFGLKFEGSLLVGKDKSWSIKQTFAFNLKKDGGSNPKDHLISWETDLNGDQQADLVVCDPSSGVHYFPSLPDGGQSENGIKLGKAPNRLLCAPDRLLFCDKIGDSWTCEWVKP